MGKNERGQDCRFYRWVGGCAKGCAVALELDERPPKLCKTSGQWVYKNMRDDRLQEYEMDTQAKPKEP